ncbi:hypothetical protein UFOVP699_270 [uncultured Caudovirales phage]|uniref:Uncharacterized protein n=1 Tax=uncultured Caudovirales phage TaxID=2100421 RepID=A0A6J5NWD5_9CAUD|nr:hypothetical protein UFOVP699_270 [uncultured Caudovirales phage]
MKKIKVLVLGNSPQINQINFEKLDPTIITLGVNRIWLKHIPNYFFFHDLIISNELGRYPEILNTLRESSTIISSDWITKNKTNEIPEWTKVYPRLFKRHFPDSVTTSIQILSRYVIDCDITFYVAGVTLTWQEPSHFWKELEYSANNYANRDWYSPRFNMTLNNFKYLKSLKYDIVSVTPNSQLNKVFRYENIENLYLT